MAPTPSRLKFIAFALLLASTSGLANAAEDPQDLGTCMIDNTTGKDRKALATWIYLAVSAHPVVNRYSQITDAEAVAIQKSFAEIVMRLLTESCAAQARLAMAKQGSKPIKDAFELLGRVAVQELMAHPDVDHETSGFLPYLDESKLQAALAE